MDTNVRTQIVGLRDADYQRFASSHIPNINTLLGVRLPELRKLAKQIAKDDWESYLKTANDDYFEEVMLQGMVIGYVKADIEKVLTYVAAFVPKINNWSVCDS